MRRFWVGLLVVCGVAGVPAMAGAAEADDACARAVRGLATGGADYKPGVDVYGRPVAPADLQPGLRVEPPKVIEFPIDLDLAKRMGFNAQGHYEGKIAVARVRIEGNRITVDGQEIVADDGAALIAACRANAAAGAAKR